MLPLAARMRPRTLEEVMGQEHIVGRDKLLYRAIQADKVSSVICLKSSCLYFLCSSSFSVERLSIIPPLFSIILQISAEQGSGRQ